LEEWVAPPMNGDMDDFDLSSGNNNAVSNNKCSIYKLFYFVNKKFK